MSRSQSVPEEDREKRRGERVSAVLPVRLGTTTGVTRDVSATGIFFETDVFEGLGELVNPGDLVNFTVEFNSSRGKTMLHCQGDVVRVEQRDSGVGVAVRITESVMRLA
jgi:hypothetical protein